MAPDAAPERYSVPQAARRLGISERAVRKRIAAGTLAAERDGARWLVLLPDDGVPSSTEGGPGPVPGGPDAAPGGTGTAEALSAAIALADRLTRENVALAGQVGFYQARVQALEEQVKQLQAPAEAVDQPPVVEASTSEPPAARPWWRRWWR